MKLALAVCAFCLLPIGVASAQAPQCNDFLGLKTEAEQIGAAVRDATQHKAERQEVCALATRFSAAQEAVVTFLVANKTLCNIPEAGITQAKANLQQTLKLLKFGCSEPPGAQPTRAVGTPSGKAGHNSSESLITVPMNIENGIYVVPVLINDAITLNFVVDSGATDVSIPADVVRTLMRTGTIKKTDFLGEKTYVLADGSKVPSQTFRIRSLKVGNKVIENVNGSVASVNGGLLLGQSFLRRFRSWSVDNTKHALLLSE